MNKIMLYLPLILLIIGHVLFATAMFVFFGWAFGLLVLGVQFMGFSYSIQSSREGN